ncbi:hypothetical protein NQZ68_026769 [Dissostichus eleginoides]|nr:hypothetical protein NQZ68_026769 [Dissostichus eleginoides]
MAALWLQHVGGITDTANWEKTLERTQDTLACGLTAQEEQEILVLMALVYRNETAKIQIDLDWFDVLSLGLLFHHRL